MKIVRSVARLLGCSVLASACASKQPPTQPVAQLAETSLTLCVIDTLAPGGMMQINAINVRATSDTLVLQKDGRVPLRQIVAGPKTLKEANWITGKQPLQLTTASGRVRFSQTSAPRALAPGRAILLGMMRGLPVFALPAEGGALRAELESYSARGIDLENALAKSVTLRRQMDKVKTLYIPTSLVGCTFQPFTRAQPRRR